MVLVLISNKETSENDQFGALLKVITLRTGFTYS